MKSIDIVPMDESFILWRCLHSGPLSLAAIEQLPADAPMELDSFRKRNSELLIKLIQTYGACAILARDKDKIVGLLRFYPKAVWDMKDAGYLCLQQDFPAGPADTLAESDFPELGQIKDKTLVIHCLMTGSPQKKENPYQRQGLGSQMVQELVRWAKANGWKRIEAHAFEDLPLIYEITGSAGYLFWEKLGFSIVDRYPHPHLLEPSEFISTLEKQAKSVGISLERAKDQIIMQLSLRSSN
jgi:hypothetical protein